MNQQIKCLPLRYEDNNITSGPKQFTEKIEIGTTAQPNVVTTTG